MNRISILALSALFITACSQPSTETTSSSSESMAPKVSSAHGKMFTLDAHLDTPAFFHRDDYTFSQRGNYEKDRTQVDLVRLREGGLDGGFWVIYTSPGPLDKASYTAARTSALLRQTSIREMAAKYSDSVELAFTADDAERIHDAGKIVVFQSMENAYPLGEDISLLESFYVAGLRMVGPVHFMNNQFADSATDEPIYGGLSELGKELVREANRLGLIVDASHASDESTSDMIDLSTTPVVLSHSGPDGVYAHRRNLPDELLVKLAESGGVIHVNALGSYLEDLQPSPERAAALEGLEAKFGKDFSAMSEQQQMAYRTAIRELNAKLPRPRSTFEKYMEHLLYTIELVGVDHVGIGADWDGGGGVIGMSDITSIDRITDGLIEAGYSEADIEKIWSGNVLRLMRAAEAARTSDLVSPDVLN